MGCKLPRSEHSFGKPGKNCSKPVRDESEAQKTDCIVIGLFAGGNYKGNNKSSEASKMASKLFCEFMEGNLWTVCTSFIF